MVVKIYLKESYLRAFSRIKYDKNTPTKSGKKAKGLFLPPLSRYPPYSTHMILLLLLLNRTVTKGKWYRLTRHAECRVGPTIYIYVILVKSSWVSALRNWCTLTKIKSAKTCRFEKIPGAFDYLGIENRVQIAPRTPDESRKPRNRRFCSRFLKFEVAQNSPNFKICL